METGYAVMSRISLAQASKLEGVETEAHYPMYRLVVNVLSTLEQLYI